MGTFTLKDERVLRAKDEVELYYKNERVEELDLSCESSGQPAYLTHGDLAWYIMKRHTSRGKVFGKASQSCPATILALCKCLSLGSVSPRTKKMRFRILYILSFIFFLSSCGPSQKIINSWINPEAASRAPYKSIFIIVLSQSKETSFSVEDRIAAIIASRGQKYVVSSAVFPPNLSISENFTRDQMAEAIKRTGCDAVFVIALLDVKTVESYHPGSAYYPMNYGMYGSYYGYYNYYYPQIYSPGYYSTNKTYYIESNFYDLEQDQLLWSIQSEAYNPASLDSWFDRYSYDLLNELKQEGLIEH